MKRRNFLSLAGATAILPVLPLSAASVPAAAAPVPASLLNWAALFARTHAKASPALIETWLGLGAAQSEVVMADLVRRGIVRAPIAGTAAAVKPMYQSRAIPGAQAVTAKVKDLIEDYMRDAVDPDVDPDTIEGTQATDDTKPASYDGT